ncbi:MAG: DJ-1 family glyoxalase III [Prevotella sp.]
MAKIYLFLAEGFEDTEALATTDVLRRGNVEVVLVSVTGERNVSSNTGTTVVTDKLFEECDFSDADAVVLPGGMPGTINLDRHAGLRELLKQRAKEGKLICAICAAPTVLAHNGILKGYKVTCYPSFESEMKGAIYTREIVTEDRNIITAEGPAAALPFGYAILRRFLSGAEVDEIEDSMRFTHLMNQ